MVRGVCDPLSICQSSERAPNAASSLRAGGDRLTLRQRREALTADTSRQRTSTEPTGSSLDFARRRGLPAASAAHSPGSSVTEADPGSLCPRRRVGWPSFRRPGISSDRAPRQTLPPATFASRRRRAPLSAALVAALVVAVAFAAKAGVRARHLSQLPAQRTARAPATVLTCDRAATILAALVPGIERVVLERPLGRLLQTAEPSRQPRNRRIAASRSSTFAGDYANVVGTGPVEAGHCRRSNALEAESIRASRRHGSGPSVQTRKTYRRHRLDTAHAGQVGKQLPRSRGRSAVRQADRSGPLPAPTNRGRMGVGCHIGAKRMFARIREFM